VIFLNNRTLLVVEDEVLIRLDMTYLLEIRGFIVLQAANADEAISILSFHPEIRGY
jgi:CheY-like chemotaxis protein